MSASGKSDSPMQAKWRPKSEWCANAPSGGSDFVWSLLLPGHVQLDKANKYRLHLLAGLMGVGRPLGQNKSKANSSFVSHIKWKIRQGLILVSLSFQNSSEKLHLRLLN